VSQGFNQTGGTLSGFTSASLTDTSASPLSIASISTGTVTAKGVSGITIGSLGQITTTATGRALILDAGAGNFVNNSNASALNASNGGSWLVYTANPTGVIKGGLTSNFRHYGATSASYAPGSVTEPGNGFIYASAAGNLTVTPTLTGTASSTYGSTPTATMSYTLSGTFTDTEDTASNIVVTGGAVFSPTLASTTNAGNYTISYSSGLSSIAGYGFVTGTGVAYTVNPATLTYLANSASRSYGGANAALNGTVSGFVNGETLAGATTGTLAFSSPAITNSNVGSYAINGTGLTANNGNYTFVQSPANATAYTINPLVVTLAGSRAYDGTTGVAGSILTANNLVPGDVLSLTGSGTLASKNAGNQAISSFGTLTLNNANYTLTGASGVVAIAQAPLTISAVTDSKTYDGTVVSGGVPLTTGTVFAGDSLTGIVQNFDTRNVGTGKTLTASGVVNDSNGGANYAVTFTPVTTGTITTRPITVTAVTDTKTYDGTASSVGIPTITGGLGTGDTSGFLQTFGTTNAGVGKTLNASGVVNDGNTGGNYSVTFVPVTNGTINAATLTYVANTVSINVGLPIPALSGTVSGVASVDTLGSITTGTLSFNTTATQGSPAASYPIDGSGLTVISNNYNSLIAHAAANAAALTIKGTSSNTTGNAPILAPILTILKDPGFSSNDTTIDSKLASGMAPLPEKVKADSDSSKSKAGVCR
jgi:hypothetical protein